MVALLGSGNIACYDYASLFILFRNSPTLHATKMCFANNKKCPTQQKFTSVSKMTPLFSLAFVIMREAKTA